MARDIAHISFIQLHFPCAGFYVHPAVCDSCLHLCAAPPVLLPATQADQQTWIPNAVTAASFPIARSSTAAWTSGESRPSSKDGGASAIIDVQLGADGGQENSSGLKGMSMHGIHAQALRTTNQASPISSNICTLGSVFQRLGVTMKITMKILQRAPVANENRTCWLHLYIHRSCSAIHQAERLECQAMQESGLQLLSHVLLVICLSRDSGILER